MTDKLRELIDDVQKVQNGRGFTVPEHEVFNRVKAALSEQTERQGVTDTTSGPSCEKGNHIYGIGGLCVFCKQPKPAAPPAQEQTEQAAVALGHVAIKDGCSIGIECEAGAEIPDGFYPFYASPRVSSQEWLQRLTEELLDAAGYAHAQALLRKPPSPTEGKEETK